MLLALPSRQRQQPAAAPLPTSSTQTPASDKAVAEFIASRSLPSAPGERCGPLLDEMGYAFAEVVASEAGLHLAVGLLDRLAH